MIKRYSQFIKENKSEKPGPENKNSKKISIKEEEMNLFNDEPSLQKLIIDNKIAILNGEVWYNDEETKKILDEYLEIPGDVNESVDANSKKELEELAKRIKDLQAEYDKKTKELGEKDEYKDLSMHNPYYESDEFDDEEDLKPIGVDNLESEGTNGLVCIFSPLESDMVEGWNNDEKVKKFIEEKRLFLSELSYDEWSIYGIEGDKEVRNYIMKNYSW